MLQRYLGSKQQILAEILEAIGSLAPQGALVCDAFSGTLAVSLALKTAGFRVASNDCNFFSYMYGVAYLQPYRLPNVSLEPLIGRRKSRLLRKGATAALEQLKGQPGFAFLAKPEHAAPYIDILTLVRFLQTVREDHLPQKARHRYISATYTAEGAKSAFISLRGSKGRRRFFSWENGRRIDVILSVLRYWWRERLISDQAHATLVCVLMDAIGKVSNTQGTYHDFPRDFTDQRALKPLKLAPPEMDPLFPTRPQTHLLGCEEDSTEFVNKTTSNTNTPQTPNKENNHNNQHHPPTEFVNKTTS